MRSKNSRIRVIYTIPNFDTCGSGVALMKLIMGLDKQRFEPILVCNHGEGNRFKMVLESGVKYYFFDYLAPLKPRWKLVIGVLRTALFFLKLRPDIVFSYHYGSNFSEAVAARIIGSKFIYVKKNMSWIGPSYNQWKVKTKLSNAITVQNTDMMREFFQNLTKAKLISIGVDTSEYYHRQKNLNLLKELDISLNSKIVLCVANIIPKKGIDYLLHGFKAIDNIPNVILIIVGDYDNEYGLTILDLKIELGISNRIIFTGKRFDVEEFYSIADLFILPSTGNEGAPIVIQEAMASGVVVLTTNTPGNRDQLVEFPNQLFEPSSAGDITNILKKYLDLNADEKRQTIELQTKFIKEKYSLEAEIDKHQKLYSQLIYD